jgi:replicative DNA helicase
MPDAAAHGKVVLSAIVANRSTKALDYAAARIGPEHFTDRAQQVLFQLLVRYADRAGGIMPREALTDLLRSKPPGSVQMYGETYDTLTTAPTGHAFFHSVAELQDLAALRATEEALATGKLILRETVRLEDNREVHGHEDAREYVLAQFSEAERAAGAQDSPEGDIRTEGSDILAAYAQAKEMRRIGKVQGAQFGIPSLDGYLDGGLGNGEVGILVAGTTVGKSSLCVQAAWYNAVECGRNVLVFTTEQHRNEVRLKIVCRHSKHPKFGLAQGIDSAAVRTGCLTPDEEKAFAWVVDDLKSGGYGEIQVVQMPEQCTLPVMAGRAAHLARRTPPDLVVVDYLQQFEPARRSRESRLTEDQSGIVKGAKRWATTFLKGRGVPVISPWQVNKDGLGSLRTGGDFQLEDLSQTTEASKTPGVVLALQGREEDISGGRNAALELKVLKNRNGRRGRKFQLVADYATSTFTDREDTVGGDLLARVG